jgi:hypothetical protein
MASRLTAAVAILALLASVAGCGIAASTGQLVTQAPPSRAAGESLSPGLVSTRGELVRALGTVNVILDDANVPVRPAEAPSLAASPRAVFQAVLPDDPTHGFISVYELGTVEAATAAANEQVAYVNSGPGRVQFTPDTQFVVRRLGTTVIFHAFSRENAADPRAAEVFSVLSRVGQAP